MDELHLEGDLYLGFASFAYYVKIKHGYNLSRSGEYHLILTGEGVYFPFELTLDCSNAECGYVYVISGDWGKLFGANFDLAQDLSEKCWRRKGRLPPNEKDWHCHIDDSLKGRIEVELKNKVVCKHPPILLYNQQGGSL
jgi:hypothetical protein